MRRKLLLPILVICFGILAFGGISVSAETYGDLTYYISNGEVMIAFCEKTATEVVIPKTIDNCPVTSIRYHAFYDCTSLTNITIPDSVTSIGYEAFYNCASLTSITIPDSVTSIEGWAFAGCTSLKRVNMTDISSWCNMDFGSANANPLYHGAELYLNDNIVTDLVIPDGVTSIGMDAFYNCKSLVSVTISDSVTSIGLNAFFDCSAVENIYYGGSEEDWDSIVIGSGNDCLTNKDIITFGTVIQNTKTTLLAKTPDYDIYTVVPTNIPVGSEMIFACYYKNKLTYVETRTYEGENPFYFVENSVGEYDEVKIIVWESFNNLKPVCDFESVDI